LLVLSGVVAILSAASLVGHAAGFDFLPWTALLAVLGVASIGFVATMLFGPTAHPEPLPAHPRALKKHRPRGRAKKRIVRNAMKRRRFRKMSPILLSHDTELVNPGGEQVGFFG